MRNEEGCVPVRVAPVPAPVPPKCPPWCRHHDVIMTFIIHFLTSSRSCFRRIAPFSLYPLLRLFIVFLLLLRLLLLLFHKLPNVCASVFVFGLLVSSGFFWFLLVSDWF